MSHTNIYINNFKALKKKYAVYAEYFENNECEDESIIPAIKDVSKDRHILSVRKNNSEFLLESEYDNSIYLEKFFDKIPENWELDGKLFMFGFGNGMYIEKFLNKFSEDHSIFVYEPSERLFRFVMEYYDIANIIESERVHFYLEGKFNTMSLGEMVASALCYTDLFTYKYCYCTNYVLLFNEYIDNYVQLIEDVFTATNGDRLLYETCGEMFLDNNYSNYKYYLESKSINEVLNCVPENVPAIIVSTGPSLNKNIDELKRAVGHAVIIAVDASIDVLSRKGIAADIMVAIDPTKGEDYLKEEESKKVPLACELNTAKGFLATHTGPKFFSLSYNGYSNMFLSANNIIQHPLSTGGSVANSAFSLALLLGCETIIFVGQDLAFTGEKTHAEGSVRGNEGKDYIDNLSSTKVILEDIYGEPIQSCIEYRRFKIWFENRIKEARSVQELRVIDATEGGAKINGTEIKTLRETIDEVCIVDYSLRDELEKANDLFTCEQKIEFIDYMNDLLVQIEACKKDMAELLEIYNKISDAVNDGMTNTDDVKELSLESIKRLDEIQSNKALQFVNEVATGGINEILSRVYQTKNDIKEEMLAICEVGREYLEEMEKGIKIVTDVAERNKQQLKELRDRYVKML